MQLCQPVISHPQPVIHINVMIICCHFFCYWFSFIHSSSLLFILPCLWFIVCSSPSGSAVTSRANIVESKVSIGACFYVHNVFCNICIFVPWSCVFKFLPSIVFTDFHFSILYPSFFFVLFQIQRVFFCVSFDSFSVLLFFYVVVLIYFLFHFPNSFFLAFHFFHHFDHCSIHKFSNFSCFPPQCSRHLSFNLF